MKGAWSGYGVRAVQVSVAAVLSLAACSGGDRAGGGGERPRVAVSIFPLYDVARRVAGERLDVVCVLPPGRSEHGYDPTPREMARVANSRMALVVGLEMDEWAERIVRGASDAAPEIVRLGDAVDARRMTAHEVGMELGEQEHEGALDHGGHGAGEPHHDDDDDDDDGDHDDHDEAGARDEHDEHGARDEHGEHGARDEHGAHDAHGAREEHGHHHHHGGLDPHFWLDPVRMQRAAAAMGDAFARLDPEGAAGYRERAAAVQAEIGRAHDDIAARSRTWTRRTLVTFHGSFGYFAERYGLRIAAVIEPFPGREPTPRYMQEVLAAIRASGAAALFSEPQLDPRPARVIAQEAGVPLFELDPIGGTGAASTYEGLLRANADVLERALR